MCNGPLWGGGSSRVCVPSLVQSFPGARVCTCELHLAVSLTYLGDVHLPKLASTLTTPLPASLAWSECPFVIREVVAPMAASCTVTTVLTTDTPALTNAANYDALSDDYTTTLTTRR